MAPRKQPGAQSSGAVAVDSASGSAPYCYEYPRPAVTVDVVFITFQSGALQVLLVERAKEPFAKQWALPGGFVEVDEPLDVAARRELREETGFSPHYLQQLYAFGAPHRDPRGRTISIAHLALGGADDVAVTPLLAGDDAADARWWRTDALPPLAFDHAEILAHALERLRASLDLRATARALLPASFTLSTLQQLHEQILGVSLDKRNFRRKQLDSKQLQETGELNMGDHRPAHLYRFAPETDAH